ncbi:MAG: phospholipase D family protein [Candidatus Micrarchaeia archaeon]
MGSGSKPVLNALPDWAAPFAGGFLAAFVLFAILYSSGFFIPRYQAQAITTPVFSPGSEPEIISLIESSQSSLDLEMYTFSNMRIADAIVALAARGVPCRVILEARVDGSSNLKMAEYLSSHGVEVRFASGQYALTHSKMMIIDGKTVLVGSINFSNNAVLKNREAAVVLEGAIANDYESVFEKDWQDAVSYAPNN